METTPTLGVETPEQLLLRLEWRVIRRLDGLLQWSHRTAYRGIGTDFLDLRSWPAFNLADTFIVVGVGILFVALLVADRPHRRPRLGTTPLSRR